MTTPAQHPAPEVPTTRESAAEAFTCRPLSCRLSGQACAQRWAAIASASRQGAAASPATARARFAGRGLASAKAEPCANCAAGAARATLLDIQEPRPAAPRVAPKGAPNTLDVPPPGPTSYRRWRG